MPSEAWDSVRKSLLSALDWQSFAPPLLFLSVVLMAWIIGSALLGWTPAMLESLVAFGAVGVIFATFAGIAWKQRSEADAWSAKSRDEALKNKRARERHLNALIEKMVTAPMAADRRHEYKNRMSEIYPVFRSIERLLELRETVHTTQRKFAHYFLGGSLFGIFAVGLVVLLYQEGPPNAIVSSIVTILVLYPGLWLGVSGGLAYIKFDAALVEYRKLLDDPTYADEEG